MGAKAIRRAAPVSHNSGLTTVMGDLIDHGEATGDVSSTGLGDKYRHAACRSGTDKPGIRSSTDFKRF